MSDLEKFLRRRLAEDEAAAFEAASGPVVTDLVAWLRAQLDADERTALAALRYDLPAAWVAEHGGVRTVEPYHRPGHVWDGQTVIVARVLGTVGEFHAEMRNAEHIAVHDPARVLRQVAAMRKIANEHAPRTTSYLDAPDELSCRRCGKADEYPVPYPCPTLQSLATVYADRDGYQPEWAPE